jgi:5-formyltetrahydrofolate cyclo-ligase
MESLQALLTLAAAAAAPAAPAAVALAFREQLLAPGALPMDAHDRHVDVIATAQGLLLCSDRAKAHLAAAADAR